MEVMTALMIAGVGFGAMKSATELKNARSEAKATIKAGELSAKNKAIQTSALAAQQKSSFLTSGLELEGTPISVISSTYRTGKEDVQQILENANIKSSNIMGKARSGVLTNLMQGAMTGLSASNALSSLTSSTSTLDFSGNFTGIGSEYLNK